MPFDQPGQEPARDEPFEFLGPEMKQVPRLIEEESVLLCGPAEASRPVLLFQEGYRILARLLSQRAGGAEAREPCSDDDDSFHSRPKKQPGARASISRFACQELEIHVFDGFYERPRVELPEGPLMAFPAHPFRAIPVR